MVLTEFVCHECCELRHKTCDQPDHKEFQYVALPVPALRDQFPLHQGTRCFAGMIMEGCFFVTWFLTAERAHAHVSPPVCGSVASVAARPHGSGECVRAMVSVSLTCLIVSWGTTHFCDCKFAQLTSRTGPSVTMAHTPACSSHHEYFLRN